jgi:hypothetical protein
VVIAVGVAWVVVMAGILMIALDGRPLWAL